MLFCQPLFQLFYARRGPRCKSDAVRGPWCKAARELGGKSAQRPPDASPPRKEQASEAQGSIRTDVSLTRLQRADWSSRECPAHDVSPTNGGEATRTGARAGASRGSLSSGCVGALAGQPHDGAAGWCGPDGSDVGGAASPSRHHVEAGSRRQRLLLGRCFSAKLGSAPDSGMEAHGGAESKRSRRP